LGHLGFTGTSDDGRSGPLGLSTSPVLFLIDDHSVSLSRSVSQVLTLSLFWVLEKRGRKDREDEEREKKRREGKEGEN